MKGESLSQYEVLEKALEDLTDYFHKELSQSRKVNFSRFFSSRICDASGSTRLSHSIDNLSLSFLFKSIFYSHRFHLHLFVDMSIVRIR